MPPIGRRFQPGNPGGPGRPKREVERRYLTCLVGAVPLREWRAVIQKALEQAKDGDGVARAWLSKHLLGDNPLAMLEVVEELRAELETLRHVHADPGERGAEPLGGAEGPARGGGPGPGGPRLAPLPGTAKRSA
jgi:hypothetical protein